MDWFLSITCHSKHSFHFSLDLVFVGAPDTNDDCIFFRIEGSWLL